VTDIVPIGIGMSRQNLIDAGGQSDRPSSGLRQAGGLLALSHVDGGRLTAGGWIVTAVPEQSVHLRLHRGTILMSGGQGRLTPSPGSFLVVSMPSLLPLAISPVAWSSTQDGPFHDLSVYVGLRSKLPLVHGNLVFSRWRSGKMTLELAP